MSRNVVVCPDCGAENMRGEESCCECSASLVQLDKSPDRDGRTAISRDRIGDLSFCECKILSVSDSVHRAVRAMRGMVDACVVVMKGGRPVGIVTERDILYKVAGRDPATDTRTLEQLMTGDPVRVYTDDRVAAAFNKMAVGGFRHVPVFKGDQLVGVLSMTTLLKYLREHCPR